VIRGGRPWFHVLDLAGAMNESWNEARAAFGRVPEEWRTLRPSPSGEVNVPWIGLEGLAWFLGGESRRPGANRLRHWLFETALPTLFRTADPALRVTAEEVGTVLRAEPPSPRNSR
jgi:hypothetical protein